MSTLAYTYSCTPRPCLGRKAPESIDTGHELCVNFVTYPAFNPLHVQTTFNPWCPKVVIVQKVI